MIFHNQVRRRVGQMPNPYRNRVFGIEYTSWVEIAQVLKEKSQLDFAFESWDIETAI